MGMDGVLKLYFGRIEYSYARVYQARGARRPLADGFTYYTENAGLPSLHYVAGAILFRTARGGAGSKATEITVTASGVQALSVRLRCMVDPGDEALVSAAFVA